MFKVHNADFIADKLATELLPDQEYREVAKNAEEAVRRRMDAEGVSTGGRIEFDVDWAMFAQTGVRYVCCADNGDAMNRSNLERYMTTLAVEGAGGNQSIHGNQGMGLKISGPTRHKEGVLIRSWLNGQGWAIQVGWNKQDKQYGAIPLGADGEIVVPVPGDMFPDFIREKGSGTVVTFLGNHEHDRTFLPPDRPRGWLFKYLHRRFFRFSREGIEMLVRVPSGDEEDWPTTEAEAQERMRGTGKSFNLSKVYGTAEIWSTAAKKGGAEGVVDVPGDPGNDIPAAKVHWWVLPTGTGTDVTSRTENAGSLAVLYQNELHDWRSSNQANPYFARLGILFGKSRIAFIIEPLGTTVTADFARAHVLVGGKPVFESDAWLVWAEQFRSDERFPEQIKAAMEEEQSRLQADDPDRARRIRERLKDVMSLLRPRRYRRSLDGKVTAVGPDTTGPGDDRGSALERRAGTRAGASTPGTRGIGAVLSQMDDTSGDTANEVFSILSLEPKWVTEAEAEGISIVSGNGKGLHDRAAALAGEDGITAPILLLNKDFRGYQSIIAAVNEWANSDGDEAKAALIETSAQEWIEQKMVEAVNGLRQLENGSSWTAVNFDDALSPVGLTAAFMADRYHTLREVKRAVGSVRRTEPTNA
ncbi:MAG TPA: hypothetical protein VHD81_03980 [Mycobacteriales bacterium]|nr:hypothetical protein [Mycobacteriales bacterium]